MTADTEQVWEDLHRIVDTALNSEIIANPDAVAVMLDTIVLNQCAGFVADQLFKLGSGEGTQFDVASAVCKVIVQGFVILSRLVPDAREYWEINLRELVVHLDVFEEKSE